MVGIKKRAKSFFHRIGDGILSVPRNFRLFLIFGALTVILLLLALCTVGIMRCAALPAVVQETPSPETIAPTLAPATPAVDSIIETTFTALEKGNQNAEVTLLQERLMDLGYLDIDEPTDYFGSATQYAVKLFQRQHDLEQDGIVGEDTANLLYGETAQHYVMKVGAEGRDIKALQQQLYELGYIKKGDIDSVFGEGTTEAVIAFQKRNSLKTDGLAGEKTIEKLYSADARVSSSKQKELDAEAKKEKSTSSSSSTSSASSKIDKMISTAKAQIGDEYALGDRGPDSFDCSGLVYYVLNAAGYKGHRLNAQGYANNNSWQKIDSMDDIKKGDLLFFTTPGQSGVTHVGIYIGNNTMIDASSGNGKVVSRSCKTNYWKTNFVCARRPFK